MNVQLPRSLSGAVLVAANLVPLAGVLLAGWSVSSVIILYWFENVVIGVINVLKMAALSPAGSLARSFGADVDRAAMLTDGDIGRHVGRAGRAFKLFVIPFFIVHYFAFCAGHGVFVFSMFPDDAGFFAEPNGMELIGTLGRAIDIFATPLALAAFALLASHLVSFVLNYWIGGERDHVDLRRLMTMPYGRIVVLHVTIILGGIATLSLGEPVWLVAIFVAVKIAVDYSMHVREHRKAAAKGPASSEADSGAPDVARPRIALPRKARPKPRSTKAARRARRLRGSRSYR